MSKVFTAVIEPKEGNMSLLMDDVRVLQIAGTGDVTLYGPDNEVLRHYLESEIDDKQDEIDEELKALFDAAYEDGAGAVILNAFAVLGANLDVVLSMSAFDEDDSDAPSVSLN